MAIKRLTKAFRLLPALALALSVAGCMKEDLSDCDDVFTITVKAYNADNVELNGEDVRDVTLYVFDRDTRYVRRVETQVGRRVSFTAPQGHDIHIVAWGNLGGGLQNCSQPQPGDHKDDCCVDLVLLSRASAYYQSPDDLFHGEISVANADSSGEQLLPVYRTVGSMAVTVKGLKEYTGYTDNDFSVTVRDTYSTIDFSGNYTGEKTASYAPKGSFTAAVGRSQYTVPAFNLIAEDESIYIDIYHGAELIATVPSPGGGDSITVERGMLTNVLIDFDTDVRVVMTDWGEEHYWKEF